jgi:hypothetical protein
LAKPISADGMLPERSVKVRKNSGNNASLL